ncbi:copper amine oxidase N-terminal domain-containing protein [Peptococcus simiae]|uniref:Copper amine oxidase N-terminal domain-containing protein n=1 Tax=Peptococcus simiae TaxID=1643805 RepID=A0ABW9H2S6_9FIRM
MDETLALDKAAKAEVYVDGVANRPAKMVLDRDGLVRDKKDQKVYVTFDKDFSPAKADKVELQVAAYTDKDAKLDLGGDKAAYTVTEISKKGVELTINPVKGAAYYTVSYVSDGKTVADLTQKLPVGADFSAASELVLDFGKDTVEPGEKIAPKVYLKNKDGETMDVSGRATFAYAGDALEEKGREKGGFTVKNDKKYIGSQITVTAVDGTRAVTKTLTVGKAVAPVEKKNVVLSINSKDMLVNGEKVLIDAPAVINNSRTFVPLRAVAEAFGVKVDYDNASRSITLTQGDKVVKMTVDNKAYTVNGLAHNMDVAPYIVAQAGRTMVPARFAAEPFGFVADFTQNTDGSTANVLFHN